MNYENVVCFNCGNPDAEVFLVETIQCNECDNEMHILYNHCEKCLTMWKTVGDTVLTVFDVSSDFVGCDLCDPFVVEYPPVGTSMEDQLFKCVKCNSTAYEIAENLYKCSDDNCGFEWEVVKCG